MGGIPGLWAAALPARRRDAPALALAGRRAHVELRVEPGALDEVAGLARGAGLEVLGEADTTSHVESKALGALLSDRSPLVGQLPWPRRKS